MCRADTACVNLAATDSTEHLAAETRLPSLRMWAAVDQSASTLFGAPETAAQPILQGFCEDFQAKHGA